MKLRVGKGALAPCPPHGVNWWARGVYHRARVRATRWLCLPYENPRFNFQTTAVNSLRHCRARPGNPSSSKMILRRLMDARVKPGHDECRHLDSKHTFTTSRRDAPEALLYLPPKEGVGNAGCPWHPRPRVHLVVVERTRVTTSTPESPDVPARNGFNGFLRALVSAKSARMWERAVLTNRPLLDLSPFVLEGL